MEAALGKGIFDSSIIIATMGNKLDDEELEFAMESLYKIVEKYNIKGGAIDCRCQYDSHLSNKVIVKNPILDSELECQWEELKNSIQVLDFFDTRFLLEDLKE